MKELKLKIGENNTLDVDGNIVSYAGHKLNVPIRLHGFGFRLNDRTAPIEKEFTLTNVLGAIKVLETLYLEEVRTSKKSCSSYALKHLIEETSLYQALVGNYLANGDCILALMLLHYNMDFPTNDSPNALLYISRADIDKLYRWTNIGKHNIFRHTKGSF